MGMNFTRRLGSLAFIANDMKTLDLPRNYAYDHLKLRLTADITIITAATTAFADGPWKLIKRLEVVANGKDVIMYIDGPALARYAQLMMGVTSASAVPTAVAANQAMNSYLKLPFAMFRSVKPIDTLLNAFQHTTLELRVTWGAASDVYKTNSANATINTATLKVTARESIGNQGGMTAKLFTIEKEVTTTSREFTINIPTRNAYRGFLIRAEVDGDVNESVINSLEIKSGADVFHSEDWLTLRDSNKIELDIETMPTGYAFVDFCPDGYLSEAINAAALQSLDIVMDVTKQAGVNKITIVPVELVLPGKAA